MLEFPWYAEWLEGKPLLSTGDYLLDLFALSGVKPGPGPGGRRRLAWLCPSGHEHHTIDDAVECFKATMESRVVVIN